MKQNMTELKAEGNKTMGQQKLMGAVGETHLEQVLHSGSLFVFTVAPESPWGSSLTRRPGQAGGMSDRTTVTIDLSLYDSRLSSPIQRHLPSPFRLKVTWITAWGISASVGNTDREEGKPQIKRQMLQSKMRQEPWKPKCHWNHGPQMQNKYPIINLRKATTWKNKIFK